MNPQNLAVGTVIKDKHGNYYVKVMPSFGDYRWSQFNNVSNITGMVLADGEHRHYEVTDLTEEEAKLIMSL